MDPSLVNKRLNELLSTSKNKSYFVGAVTVLFIILMTMVGILPAYSAFTFQNEENDRRDEVIAKLQNKVDISKALTEEYQSKTDLVNYFNKVFPNIPQQSDIVQSLTDLADKHQVYLSKLTFVSVSPADLAKQQIDPSVKAQSVTLSLEGSRENILAYLSDIELSRRIFDATTISIDKKVIDQSSITDQSNSLSKGDFEATFQLLYFYYNSGSAGSTTPTQ